MKHLYFSVTVYLLAINLFSCSPVPKEVKKALDLAGENSQELKKVIYHYQAPKDSLKLEAAYFLIKNMTGKYSLTGEKVENFNTIFDKIQDISKKRPFNYINRIDNKFPEVDSLWNEITKREGFLNPTSLEVEPDLYHITSSFLIENIDYAFKAWEFPWSKHLSFMEFCEYILPYRYRDETLTSWRPQLLNKYLPLLDSLQHIKNPVQLCDTINKILKSKWRYSNTLTKYPIAMTIENMEKAQMGSCIHQTGLGVFVMRALGLPVVHEQIPHYGRRSLGHDFNAVLGKNDKFVDFDTGSGRIGDVVNKDARKRYNFQIPKIYRQTFSLNKESLALSKTSQDKIVPYFKNPYILDVTAQYLPVSDINIALAQSPPDGSNYVYLCVFDNKNWKAVSWSKVNDNKAVFKDMGLGFVYMPMYYSDQGYIPAANPVILHEKGNVELLNMQRKEQIIFLERKYPLVYWVNRSMGKGKFQAANDPSFKDKIDLFQIDTLSSLIPQKMQITDNQKYRYVRYLFPPNNIGNIAEMSFLSQDDMELRGKTIASKNITDSIALKRAFDGNVLSYVDTKNKDSAKQWIGLDFGAKKRISKISFCPRTDKNNVWKGLNYELFYWDSGWKSLGSKKAETYSLDYESPISNTLYLLRCLDEGKEERIFTYENGKQVWW